MWYNSDASGLPENYRRWLETAVDCKKSQGNYKFAVFAQMSIQCPYTLQWDASFLLKSAPSHGGSGPLFNTWFLGPTRILNQNSIAIGTAVFAGLTSVTNRLTDHATQSITTGRIYIRSTAMRPKKVTL